MEVPLIFTACFEIMEIGRMKSQERIYDTRIRYTRHFNNHDAPTSGPPSENELTIDFKGLKRTLLEQEQTHITRAMCNALYSTYSNIFIFASFYWTFHLIPE